MLLSVVNLAASVIARQNLGLMFGLLKVELVFDIDISAMVFRQVLNTINLNYKINSTINHIRRLLREEFKIFRTVLIHRNYI